MMWDNHPYFPISLYYKNIFGQKVYKISVSTDSTCPNRGKAPCVFCDEWGSAAYHQISHKPLTEQILIARERIRKRYKANRFLVYFQSYTSTFKSHLILRQQIEEALLVDDVVGIVLGTRPDTLSDELIDYLSEKANQVDVQVELGAQTFNDKQLNYLQRGHTAQQTLNAIDKLVQKKNIRVGVHLIFGIPGESKIQLEHTAKMINAAGVHTVKLHNLHVLRNTPLEQLYQNGDFMPVKLDEYADLVSGFLAYLSPDIAIHRLAATANRWDELIAPEWTKKRMEPVQFIEDKIKKNGEIQGVKFIPPAKNEISDLLKRIQI